MDDQEPLLTYYLQEIMKDPIKQVEPHQTIKRNDSSYVDENIAKTFAKLQGMCLLVDFVTLEYTRKFF